MSINFPNADFTPQLNGYTGQGAFRFWCQKVLPIVYDDSLSYYELLNKVVNYLNNVIADVATVEENVGTLNESYNSLQAYVNEHMQELVGVINQYTEYTDNYFNNLDVQHEIDTKLDEMASDGTLSTLIGPIVVATAPDVIAAWLAEHITPTTPIVDDTLSISGAAADAKATGDKISLLKSDLTRVTGTAVLSFEDGYINIPAVGNQVDTTRVQYANRKSAIGAITEGQIADINVVGVGTTTSGGRAWAFLDSNYNVLLRAESNLTIRGKITAPENSAYIVLNTSTETIQDYYGYVGYTNIGVTAKEAKQTADNTALVVSSISEQFLYNLNELSVLRYFIDIPNGVLDSSNSVPERLIVVPVEENSTINVNIPKVSTKRVAFCNAIRNAEPVYNAMEISGSLNQSFKNESYKYLVIQLFINSDLDKDYNNYIADASISILTGIDNYAREEIEKLKESGGSDVYVTENIKGLPILNSFSDIEIDTTAYDNCSAFHNLVKTELCDTSNGYMVQTLLGNDDHGNNLYKYVTNPESVRYGANREFGTPSYPIAGGDELPIFTVILTTNIHGVEHGGNWVVYNLIKKMQNPDTDMLQFFRDCVKIIWVPYICASGEYENADGVNINRDFPDNRDGTCVSTEANLVKAVIDEYGPTANLHIDIHTFRTSGTYAQYFSSWTFTNSTKLGKRSARVSKSVVNRYARKYPDIDVLKRNVVSAVNTPTTCTYYTQTVYGIPAGTIEGALSMSGSPDGTDVHTSATAYLYDIITQVICAMAS